MKLQSGVGELLRTEIQQLLGCHAGIAFRPGSVKHFTVSAFQSRQVDQKVGEIWFSRWQIALGPRGLEVLAESPPNSASV